MTTDQVLLIAPSWILREGLKPTLRRLGVSIAGEGDDFNEAYANCAQAAPPTIALVFVSRSSGIDAGLDELRRASEAFRGVKRVILADSIERSSIVAASQAGIDALLSSDLSSRMLTSSLQLVLLNQKLFPTLPPIAAGPVREAATDAPPVQPLPRPALRPPLTDLPVPPTSFGPPTSQVIRLEDHASIPRLFPTTMSLVWNGARPASSNPHLAPAISERESQILRCLVRGESNKSIARELGIAETTVKVHIKSLLRKLCVSNRTQAAIWMLKQDSDNGEHFAKVAEAGSVT
jgi:two-component system nitrate/nitrite response regulator NarL